MVEQSKSELVEKSALETSGGGPVLRAISKRLRAFNKKIKRAEEIEAIKATGKEINDQQVPAPSTGQSAKGHTVALRGENFTFSAACPTASGSLRCGVVWLDQIVLGWLCPLKTLQGGRAAVREVCNHVVSADAAAPSVSCKRAQLPLQRAAFTVLYKPVLLLWSLVILSCLQEEALAGKAKALSVIAELERLVPLLKEAVQEETVAAVSEALAEQSANQENTVEGAGTASSQLESVSEGAQAPNGVSHPAGNSSQEDVSTAVERLVQLAYFTQVLHPCSAYGTCASSFYSVCPPVTNRMPGVLHLFVGQQAAQLCSAHRFGH